MVLFSSVWCSILRFGGFLGFLKLCAAVAIGCDLVFALVAVTQTTRGRILGLDASNWSQ